MGVLSIIGFCVALGIIMIVSVKVLGPDNEVEEIAEHLLEQEVENVLHHENEGKVDSHHVKKDNT